MTSVRRALAILVAAVLIGSVAATPAEPTRRSQLDEVDVDPDSVLLRVDLARDGDASWRVVYHVGLDDGNRSAAFEELRRDVRDDPSSFAEPFAAGVRRSVRRAEETTGRTMSVENVTVVAREQSLYGDVGVVEYRYEWRGFAERTGDGGLRVGDAIRGLYLDRDTTLRVTWPEGLTPTDVAPPTNARSESQVEWRGAREFGAGEPTIVLEPADTGDGAGTSANGGRPSVPSIPVGLIGAVIGAVVLLGLGLVVRRRTGAGPAGEPAEVPDELLSNEERVLQYLRNSGGRVKQADLAAALDWTAPKTSRVVDALREEGRVDVFRLGRENVLTLPDESLVEDDVVGDEHSSGDERGVEDDR